MKNWKKFAALFLCAGFVMSMTACGGEITLRGQREQGADPKLPEETSISPEETLDKQGETLALYEPAPDDSEPLPTEGVATAEQSGCFAFQSIRVQDVSRDKMKYLISKYLPSAGSNSTLSVVHITEMDSLENFLVEVNSDTFRGVCTLYDDTFFAQYDLLVIPRITNSGSMEYSAELVKEERELRVSISVTEPEYTTTVMTNWFLVVPVAKADAQNVTITVVMDIAADQPMPTVGWGKLG